MNTGNMVLDSAKVMSDSLARGDHLVVLDSTQQVVGTVSAWYGVMIAVAIGVTIGLVFLLRK